MKDGRKAGFTFDLEEEQEAMEAAISRNNFFMQAFDPEGERDPASLELASNSEYKDFISGICRRFTIKRFKRGEVVCHKGEVGEEMYFIAEGRIGVFIEHKSDEVESQLKRLDFLRRLFQVNFNTKTDESTVLKAVPYDSTDKLIANTKKHFWKEREDIFHLLTYFEQVDCWKKDQLDLLASDKAYQYMRNACFLYWMVATKLAGDIIGEQALLNKAPRNATLVAATEVKLLTLDKDSFDQFMGYVAQMQEERVRFFSSCFPLISKRALANFHCMFQRTSKQRGEAVTIRGSRL